MAQAARTHRHGFFPCGFIFPVARPQSVGQQVYVSFIEVLAVSDGIQIRLPLRCLLDGGTDSPVHLLLQVLGKLDSRKVGIETDVLLGRKREREDTRICSTVGLPPVDMKTAFRKSLSLA